PGTTRSAVQLDVAAVALDHALDDGKAEPAAVFAAVVTRHAIEPIEDALALIGWNSRAGVLDLEHYISVAAGNSRGNGAAIGRMPNRVVDQVAEQDAQTVFIADHFWRLVGVQLQPQARALGQGFEVHHDLASDASEIHQRVGIRHVLALVPR